MYRCIKIKIRKLINQLKSLKFQCVKINNIIRTIH